jgi:hypothetical protein
MVCIEFGTTYRLMMHNVEETSVDTWSCIFVAPHSSVASARGGWRPRSLACGTIDTQRGGSKGEGSHHWYYGRTCSASAELFSENSISLTSGAGSPMLRQVVCVRVGRSSLLCYGKYSIKTINNIAPYATLFDVAANRCVT